MAAEITRILLADDHPLLRHGLRQVIEEDSALRIVGEADDGEMALNRIEQLQPEIAVLDIDMPRLDGLGVAKQVQFKRLTVDIVSRSSKEIAEALFIHCRTVENHRASICRKLGLRGAHALLKFALAHRFEL